MFYNVESNIKPSLTDTTSSQIYNYVRKDIEEFEKEVGDETEKMYRWLEEKIPKESWGMYLELEKQKETTTELVEVDAELLFELSEIEMGLL